MEVVNAIMYICSSPGSSLSLSLSLSLSVCVCVCVSVCVYDNVSVQYHILSMPYKTIRMTLSTITRFKAHITCALILK